MRNVCLCYGRMLTVLQRVARRQRPGVMLLRDALLLFAERPQRFE